MNMLKFEFPMDNIHVEYVFKNKKETRFSTDCIEEINYFIPYAVIKSGPNTRDIKKSFSKIKKALSLLSHYSMSYDVDDQQLDSLFNDIPEGDELFSVNLLGLSDEKLLEIMSIDPKEWKIAKIENNIDGTLSDILKRDIKRFEERFSPELKLLLELDEEN